MATERRRRDREEIKASKDRDRRRRQSLKEAKALAKKTRGAVGGSGGGCVNFVVTYFLFYDAFRVILCVLLS